MAKLDLKSCLNEEQIQAVTSIEGPLLIIAGAGSGKTRVITYRIAYMLEKGIPQSSIVALTFTNKAAKEMEMRIRELYSEGSRGGKLQNLTLSTFHSFGLSIIRKEAEILGYRKNFSVYDETDRITLIKESLRECKMGSMKVNLYELGQLFSNIKTGLSVWSSSICSGFENKVFQPVYEEYQNGLKLYNAVDFDDLLVLPLQLFEQNPEILEKYRSRFQYIMIDEFQDTSLIQYNFIRLLALGRGKSDKNANICAVGDDDQSIYSWRGANYRNFLLFEEDFPGIKEIKLEQNYRSTTTILEAANGVISHNKGRKEKKLWSGINEGKPIEIVLPENENAEAKYIASQIKTILLRDTRRYHDFGVLARTNSLIANIEEAFLAGDIPYKVSGGTSFFQRKEIKDIISYLRVIANPFDDISLLRIINVPARGIGKTTIKLLGEIAKENKSCIWESIIRLINSRGGQQHLFHDKKARTELEEFMHFIEKWQQEITVPRLSQKARMLVDEIDYWSYLVREHGKEEKKARWKYSNIEYFIRMIENWENDPDTFDKGIYAWLNRISLITKDDGQDDVFGKVSLMTIHSAKGLEFPVVFIAGAEEGLIPHAKSIEENGPAEAYSSTEAYNSLEEERRLFYVAITRAREKLFISACKKRTRGFLRSEEECKPSPFLEEIPKHLILYGRLDQETDSKEESEELLKIIKERLRKK